VKFPEDLKKKDLIFLGKGVHGKVYLIRNSDSLCIKIFKKPEIREIELSNLKKAGNSPWFPKVHQWGKNYIIREYIQGIGLKTYLQNHPLTESISRQLVELIHNFEDLHFQRLDTRLNNVLINPNGRLFAIDPTSAMSVSPYPRRLLDDMKVLGHKKLFLRHVKEFDQNFYEKWAKGMEGQLDIR
jgi:predicted Ser/Thr protein kinase